MRSKRTQLSLSPQLLERIDKAAQANLMTRSSFIRESVIMRLNDQHLVPNPPLGDTLELLRQAGNKTER
jgi:metal-responsive CopG/Arc/MetJ family transcriptional regulator